MNKNTSNNGNEVLDVTPGMITYNLFENFPYTMTRALCEFIDNALHAFLEHKNNMNQDVLDVHINFFTHPEYKIEIHDDGAGIFKEEFQNALKLAHKKETPGMSEFGVGMKAAAFWFASRFTINSTPYNGKESYFIDFNLNELISSDTNTIDLIEINRNSSHGVIIELTKLRTEINRDIVQSSWEQIQDIYQLFTHIDKPILSLHAKYNNTSVSCSNDEKLYSYRTPEVLDFPEAKFVDKTKTLYAIGDKKRWEIDIAFTFAQKEVTGKVYLLKTSSQVDNPGIRLFRNKRLFKGFFTEPYRPVSLVGTANKAAPSRLFAELHLDAQSVSLNKGEFIFDENLFLATLKKQKGFQELISQAEEFRAKADPVYISKEDYQKLTNTVKQPRAKSQKAILSLYKLSDDVKLDEEVNLYDYIKSSIDSNGKEVEKNNIIIEIDGKTHGNIFKRSIPCQTIIELSFQDKNKKISTTLTLNVLPAAKALFGQVEKPLIPHIVNEAYKLQLGPVVPKLVDQINTLYKQTGYTEIIACGLRSCLEIPIFLIKQSSAIRFDNSIKNQTEEYVVALHALLYSNKRNNHIAGYIAVHTSAPSQKNLLNQFKSIKPNDILSYVKQCHLGAHGSTTSLSSDKLEGIGSYIGLFLLVADQVLNNTSLQYELNGVIPKSTS